MIRRGGALVAVVVALLAGCHDEDHWRSTAPFGSSLRPAFGARVTGGQLRIWTGSPCDNFTQLALTFSPGEVELELTAPRGVEVEHLTLGGPYPGMEVSKPLPAGFDWDHAESMRLSLYGAPVFWGSSTDLAYVIKGSSEHSDDTYWFQDVGWLNAADVAAQDGKTFLATCTPDPAKR